MASAFVRGETRIIATGSMVLNIQIKSWRMPNLRSIIQT